MIWDGKRHTAESFVDTALVIDPNIESYPSILPSHCITLSFYNPTHFITPLIVVCLRDVWDDGQVTDTSPTM